MNDSETKQPLPAITSRKQYETPRLKSFGDLSALTLKNGGTLGMNDGSGSFDKTAF